VEVRDEDSNNDTTARYPLVDLIGGGAVRDALA